MLKYLAIKLKTYNVSSHGAYMLDSYCDEGKGSLFKYTHVPQSHW